MKLRCHLNQQRRARHSIKLFCSLGDSSFGGIDVRRRAIVVMILNHDAAPMFSHFGRKFRFHHA
jgi:hypothetical protein